MNLYKNCDLVELDDNSFVLEEVLTPYGLTERVFLGPGGIYIVLSDSDKPPAVYDYFRNLLGAAKVRLYFTEKGEYLPSNAGFKDKLSPSELDASICEYIYSTPHQYTQETIERLKTALVRADAIARGCYTDEDGVVYLYRYGVFCRSSELEPERIFKLCLYGGVLGLHRFALGKWFTGLLYLFTCGFFMFGWLLDLVQIFFGFQKDKRKLLLRPLEDRKSKLKLIPFGMLITLILFFVWLQFCRAATGTAGNFMVLNSSSLSSFFQHLLPHN